MFFLISLGCTAKQQSFSAGASSSELAYTVNGDKVTVGQVLKENQAKFYDLEKQKYALIEQIAEAKYMADFWKDLAKKNKTSEDVAKKTYMEENAKVSEMELKVALQQYGSHPSLASLPQAEKEKQITDYLKATKAQEVAATILSSARKEGKLAINYPKPQEPLYDVKITANDPMRFGPKPTDTKPIACKGDDCKITVVEYSEFECPFCSRVKPTIEKLLEKYKGKVRWTVRDYPLPFHKRAKPAAIAARCAQDQGKYWEMYNKLFDNQRKLSDADITSYAKTIGLDMAKYDACVKSPAKALAVIEANTASGSELGVTGTPAFFVNGRRLSGALPYPQFEAVFEEELAK